MSTPTKPRVIVITGAAAGVGRATAQMFARTEGAHIGLLARGIEGLEGAKRDVEALGGKAIILQCDVTDADAVEAAAERVERELGAIDVWVNVAMTSVFSFIKDMTAGRVQACHGGLLPGLCPRHAGSALKRMLPRDRGHIVQVGSALAYRGIPLQAAYCASKHAIQGLMDSLQAELIHDKSRVVACMVQMPALNTPQFDWCKQQAAQPVAARAADLPAGNRRRGHRVRIEKQAARNLRGTANGHRDCGQQTLSAPGRLVPGHDRRQRPANPAESRPQQAGQSL